MKFSACGGVIYFKDEFGSSLTSYIVLILIKKPKKVFFKLL